MIESEISHLKDIVQRIQLDNKRLEQYVNEWKTIAEKSENSVLKYCLGMEKVLTVLEGIRTELPCLHERHCI